MLSFFNNIFTVLRKWLFVNRSSVEKFTVQDHFEKVDHLLQEMGLEITVVGPFFGNMFPVYNYILKESDRTYKFRMCSESKLFNSLYITIELEEVYSYERYEGVMGSQIKRFKLNHEFEVKFMKFIVENKKKFK